MWWGRTPASRAPAARALAFAARAPRLLRVPRQRHAVHGAYETRRHPLGIAWDDVARVASEHLFEEDAGLHAGQGRAEAEMLAESEREVWRVHVAADVEGGCRWSEGSLVAIA